jgi:hypothetical protein
MWDSGCCVALDSDFPLWASWFEKEEGRRLPTHPDCSEGPSWPGLHAWHRLGRVSSQEGGAAMATPSPTLGL